MTRDELAGQLEALEVERAVAKGQARVTIPCPECGHDLIVRLNGADGSRFLGCSEFPKCRHSQALPEYMRMMEAGADQLPGFEP